MERKRLHQMATEMTDVDGVVGVVLGGSRARGDHAPSSDIDLGVYYRPPLNVPDLQDVARRISGPTASLTEPGTWGAWVDGGGWLTVNGYAVDWIYRDVDRVHASWVDAQAGRYSFHHQVGHPLGVPDFAYAGELALAAVLADPTGELACLAEQTRWYPPALAHALVDGLWEARFIVAGARKAADRGDNVYVTGCLFRAFGLCAHALHACAGRWLINEKGSIAAAGRLPQAPKGFTDRAQAVFAGLGPTPPQLITALELADQLIDATTTACRRLP